MNTQTKENIKQGSNEGLRKLIYNIFCTLIFLLPVLPEFVRIGVYSLKNTLFNLTTITTLVILAILDIKEKKFKFTFYDFITSAYLVLVVISTIASKFGFMNCVLGTYGRGEGLLTIFSYIVTFTICYKGYPYIEKTYKAALTGAVIICIYGIIQANVPLSVNLPFGSSHAEGIAEGTMGNQNFLASYISMFLPMMCYYFVKSKNSKSLVVVILLFVTLVFTKTLSCYTVFIVMYIIISIFTMWHSKEKKKTFFKLFVMTTALLLVFGLIKVVKSNMYAEELVGVKEEVNNLATGNDQFATGRLLIWKKTLLAIQNNTLLGVGPDCLKMELRNIKYRSIMGDWMDYHYVDKAHSEYLQIAVTTGVPSLMIYLLLLITVGIGLVIIVYKMHKYDDDNDNKVFITMTLIAIVSYLGQAIGNISVIQVAPVFWAILGIGAGITIHEKVERKENK